MSATDRTIAGWAHLSRAAIQQRLDEARADELSASHALDSARTRIRGAKRLLATYERNTVRAEMGRYGPEGQAR